MTVAEEEHMVPSSATAGERGEKEEEGRKMEKGGSDSPSSFFSSWRDNSAGMTIKHMSPQQQQQQQQQQTCQKRRWRRRRNESAATFPVFSKAALSLLAAVFLATMGASRGQKPFVPSRPDPTCVCDPLCEFLPAAAR